MSSGRSEAGFTIDARIWHSIFSFEGPENLLTQSFYYYEQCSPT